MAVHKESARRSADTALRKSLGTLGSGHFLISSIERDAPSPASALIASRMASLTPSPWLPLPSGSGAAWRSKPLRVPSAMTIPRDGSFALASLGSLRTVHAPILNSLVRMQTVGMHSHWNDFSGILAPSLLGSNSPISRTRIAMWVELRTVMFPSIATKPGSTAPLLGRLADGSVLMPVLSKFLTAAIRRKAEHEAPGQRHRLSFLGPGRPPLDCRAIFLKDRTADSHTEIQLRSCCPPPASPDGFGSSVGFPKGLEQ